MTDIITPSNTQTQQDWRTRWDAECPMTIAVTYAGWERGSDAALREELKRIRDTGFNAVRVHFDRDNDIEKMAGMVNWRNPDRFFDAAEKAGLKVIAAPGNDPHRDFQIQVSSSESLLEAAHANIAAWLTRFCRQYQNHPALLAWALIEPFSFTDDDEESDARIRQDNRSRLRNAFHAADPLHPILTAVYDPLDNAGWNALVHQADASDLFGGVFHLQHTPGYIFGLGGEATAPELHLPAYATARMVADVTPASSVPALTNCTSGTSRYQQNDAITMNADKMLSMLLLFVAAGIKIIDFAHWKPERTGGRAGEDCFVDWLDRVTPHATAAGNVSRSAAKYAQELWQSVTRPQVYILASETNDLQTLRTNAALEATYMTAYESQPFLARMGASRVLLNANIPFAFISEEQLIADTVTPAPFLFLPHIETLSEPLLSKLKEYAANGGRVVADMPTGYLNEKGELLDTRPGSLFEQLFGASIAGLFCFSSPAMKDAEPPRGQQRANIVVTTARAGGGSGETPAFTENRVGKGRAVLVNASLSRLNAAPGLQNAQLSLLSYLLGSRQTALPGLTGCLTFRRIAEQAEHVFLVNDSAEERTVEVAVPSHLTQAHDALDPDLPPLVVENNTGRVTVAAGSGRWLRLSR